MNPIPMKIQPNQFQRKLPYSQYPSPLTVKRQLKIKMRIQQKLKNQSQTLLLSSVSILKVSRHRRHLRYNKKWQPHQASKFLNKVKKQ
jgi:hypothetical protein